MIVVYHIQNKRIATISCLPCLEQNNSSSVAYLKQNKTITATNSSTYCVAFNH